MRWPFRLKRKRIKSKQSNPDIPNITIFANFNDLPRHSNSTFPRTSQLSPSSKVSIESFLFEVFWWLRTNRTRSLHWSFHNRTYRRAAFSFQFSPLLNSDISAKIILIPLIKVSVKFLLFVKTHSIELKLDWFQKNDFWISKNPKIPTNIVLCCCSTSSLPQNLKLHFVHRNLNRKFFSNDGLVDWKIEQNPSIRVLILQFSEKKKWFGKFSTCNAR